MVERSASLRLALVPVYRRLLPRTPLAVEPLVDFLAQRAVAGVEVVDGHRYARSLRLPHGPGWLSLDIAPTHVDLAAWLVDECDADDAMRRARWLVDLDTDTDLIESALAVDPRLAPSIKALPGVRVPGHVDGFEVAVRAIVGQQISVSGARTILGRIVQSWGSDLAADDRLALDELPAELRAIDHLFPSPAALAAVDPEELPMPRGRGRALVAVAAAVESGRLVLAREGRSADVRAQLLAMPGIGPWTADYIALRAFGDPDIFLSTDLGVRQGLARLGIGADGSPPAAWSPWRSYAMTRVWLALGSPAPASLSPTGPAVAPISAAT